MGVLRSVEAIAEVQKEGACDEGLEREGGVYRAVVVARTQHVETYAHTHGEDWCADLTA